MKEIILCVFMINAVSIACLAQATEDNPAAIPVQGGILLYCGNRIPKNTTYVIERSKPGGGKYENSGTIGAPKSIREMELRQTMLSPYFTALDKITKDEMDTIWVYIQKHTFIDSIRTDNLPMLNLMAGTAFFDSTAEKGVNYTYRIKTMDASGKQVSVKESNAISSFVLPKLPSVFFSEKRYADGKLTLTWAVKDQLGLSHFNIYRSVFGKDEYQKVSVEKGVYSSKDSLMLIAIDNLGKNPAWYEYLISPIDMYGNEGEQQGHASGSNVQDYYAPPVINFKSVNTGRNHEVKLSWRFENKKYLNGISVMRSTSYDSGYQRIATIPVSDTTYTDIIPVSGENYYYYLLLLSADNSPVPTAKIFATYTGDQSLPERPNEIDATPIAKGIKVYWKSDEPYSKGFYVYRRDQPDAAFTLVSPMISTGQSVYLFTDTSNQLQAGGVYQYMVRTINDNNQLSKPSDTVSANPGITKAIANPANLRYRESDGKITLLWDDMRGWESDLLGYKVFRKTGNGSFVRIPNDSLQPDRNFFVDSSLSFGTTFVYGVKAFDNSGSESEMATITIAPLIEQLPGPPPGISVSQSGDAVFITWGQLSGDFKAIKIYRSEPGAQANLVATITDADSFNDKNVTKGKLYFYQLATVSSTNREGLKSEKLSLRVK